MKQGDMTIRPSECRGWHVSAGSIYWFEHDLIMAPLVNHPREESLQQSTTEEETSWTSDQMQSYIFAS
jgi:hypothetical protein